MDFRVVVARGRGGRPGLSNLADDIGGSRDRAAAQPAKGQELQALWDKGGAAQAPSSAPDVPVTKTGKKKGAKQK